MKFAFRIMILAAFMISMDSCKKDDAPDDGQSTSINKIMPLGASRVEGNRPTYESFRYELWKDLKENNWTFDFIGTQTDNASYPDFDGNSFDIDHEGRGGWTSGQILNNVEGWISDAGAPDIVLFSSPGGNDALQGLSYAQAITNVNSIIDIIQSSNPNVTIIIESLAPGNAAIMTPDLTTYFDQLQDDVHTIAADQTTNTSSVIVVDMSTGFTDALLADPVHYNQAGAEFIASRYYDVLVNVLEN